MARIVSFVVLLVILLLIFGLFFQVMADFLLPMFLAVLLVIIFGPVHRWFQSRFKGHERVAALVTTCTILLAFFGPASFFLFRAAQEGGNLYRKVVHRERETAPKADASQDPAADAGKLPQDPEKAPPGKAETPSRPGADAGKLSEDPDRALAWVSNKIAELAGNLGPKVEAQDIEKALHAKIEQYLTPLAVSTGQFLWRMVLGGFVMILSLYYFLADGPAMVMAVMRLSPLDDKYEAELIEQFGNITRAVVVATLLSALVQGILAGAGFYFTGVGSVFLLTVLAMLFAIVPFIGAAGVWVPVCLWLYFVEERTAAAIALAIYCGVVVSMVDNVIKPLVLHGRSNIHPLLALLSVLGGVQALGAIGIIVGPMAVAFLQTLLEMINKEMNALGKMKA